MTGFILLHRKITEWEWYQNPNTFRLFLHCLLMANFTDGRFEGKEIKRGQFVTSLPSLSAQTSLSIRQVRVALDHLILTGELTSKAYPKFRVITVVNYDKYQNNDRQIDSQMTGERQADDSQMTGERQQYKKNNKEIRKQWNNDNNSGDMDAAAAQEILAEQNRVLNAAEDAGFTRSNSVRAKLIDLYAENGLKKVLAGIESCVRHGAVNLAYLEACMKDQPKKKPVALVPAAAYEQRDYSGAQEEAIRRMMEMDMEMNANGTA